MLYFGRITISYGVSWVNEDILYLKKNTSICWNRLRGEKKFLMGC